MQRSAVALLLALALFGCVFASEEELDFESILEAQGIAIPPEIEESDLPPPPDGYFRGKEGNIYWSLSCRRPVARSPVAVASASSRDPGARPQPQFVTVPCRRFQPLHWEPMADKFNYNSPLGEHLWYNEKSGNVDMLA